MADQKDSDVKSDSTSDTKSTASSENTHSKSILWKRFTGQMIIDRKNQFTMICYIFLVTFFCAVTFQITLAVNETLMLNENVSVIPLVFSSLMGYLILFISIFLTFAISNRFVGPVYRIRMHMKKIRESGEISLVTIRSDDYFQNLAEDYNDLLKYIEANYTKK